MRPENVDEFMRPRDAFSKNEIGAFLILHWRCIPPCQLVIASCYFQQNAEFVLQVLPILCHCHPDFAKGSSIRGTVPFRLLKRNGLRF